MTDDTLTETDIANVKEVLDSQVRLGHSMTLMPTDVLARMIAALAARPAPDTGLREARHAIVQADIYLANDDPVSAHREIERAHRALAVPTPEPLDP